MNGPDFGDAMRQLAAHFFKPDSTMSPKLLVERGGELTIIDLAMVPLGQLSRAMKVDIVAQAVLQAGGEKAAIVSEGVSSDARIPGLQVKDHAQRKEVLLVIVAEPDLFGEVGVVGFTAAVDRDGLGAKQLRPWQSVGEYGGPFAEGLLRGVAPAHGQRTVH